MKKLLINRKPVEGPWGGGNHFFKATFAHFPEFGYQPVLSFDENPDAILMVDPRRDELGIGAWEIADYALTRGTTSTRPIIVHRVNECDARKGTTDVDDVLYACHGFVDEQVYVSHWLREHLHSKWTLHGDHSSLCPVIYNGVDQELFRPFGPGQNWTDKTHIVTHHWSDNPMKGLDVTMWLDQYFIPKYRDRFEYTYIGRLKGELKSSRLIPPCHGRALADEVAAGEIYISASRFDPGPNHVLEALAAGCKTFVHKDGGGAVEFAGADHAYGSLEELENILTTSPAELPHNSAIRLSSWRECIQQYAALFDELIAKRS